MSAVDSYYDDDGEGGSGWPEFAAVLLFALGFFRLLSLSRHQHGTRRELHNTLGVAAENYSREPGLAAAA